MCRGVGSEFFSGRIFRLNVGVSQGLHEVSATAASRPWALALRASCPPSFAETSCRPWPPSHVCVPLCNYLQKLKGALAMLSPASFEEVLLADERSFACKFETAIHISMKAAFELSKKPAEPDFVAMLMLVGVPYIAEALKERIKEHGFSCKVSSVFCHQRPEVKISTTGEGCELGDILIVHRHYDNRNNISRSNSLLLQAKLSSGGRYKVPGKERHQLKLYRDWPEFKYVRSGPKLNGTTRNIEPKLPHSGAQYLLIDDGRNEMDASPRPRCSEHHCMGVWPADETLYPHVSLSHELWRFFLGLSGRRFFDKLASDSSQWSRLVWDLLDHGRNFVFNRKNVGVQNEPRAINKIFQYPSFYMNFFFMSDEESSDLSTVDQQDQVIKHLSDAGEDSNNVPPSNDSSDNFDGEMGGVSVVLVETRRR
jgi:hypothetical protein